MVVSGFFMARSHTYAQAPSADLQSQLERRFLHVFPDDRHGFYSRAILASVCTLRCDIGEFHERLLDWLSRDSKRGTVQQLFVVLAMEDIFNTDGVHTPTGSFDYAALQTLIGRVVAEEDPKKRDHGLAQVVLVMQGESGWSSLDALIDAYRNESDAVAPMFLDAERGQEGDEVLVRAGYRRNDVVSIVEFAARQARGDANGVSEIVQTFATARRAGRYPAADIDSALVLAQRHPLGTLVMRRLYGMLAVNDVPAKLTELVTDRAAASNRTLASVIPRGLDPETIAMSLAGTEHTAYLNDLRLARKVVSVFQDVREHIDSPELTDVGRRRWVQVFRGFVNRKRPLRSEQLIEWLSLQNDPVSLQHGEMLRVGQVDVEIVPQEMFSAFIKNWGKTSGNQLAATILSLRGERARILIPELPPFDLSTSEGNDRAFSRLVGSVQSLAHEAEHWRHGNGLYLGAEAHSASVSLADIGREERLISETMAYLEEFRWRIKNCDRDYLEISQRLGESLSSYFRNLADRQYFLHVNQARVCR